MDVEKQDAVKFFAEEKQFDASHVEWAYDLYQSVKRNDPFKYKRVQKELDRHEEKSGEKSDSEAVLGQFYHSLGELTVILFPEQF